MPASDSVQSAETNPIPPPPPLQIRAIQILCPTKLSLAHIRRVLPLVPLYCYPGKPIQGVRRFGPRFREGIDRGRKWVVRGDGVVVVTGLWEGIFGFFYPLSVVIHLVNNQHIYNSLFSLCFLFLLNCLLFRIQRDFKGIWIHMAWKYFALYVGI